MLHKADFIEIKSFDRVDTRLPTPFPLPRWR